jgi:hypothetical protein
MTLPAFMSRTISSRISRHVQQERQRRYHATDLEYARRRLRWRPEGRSMILTDLRAKKWILAFGANYRFAHWRTHGGCQ